jgi:cytochrome c oxidase subunit 4
MKRDTSIGLPTYTTVILLLLALLIVTVWASFFNFHGHVNIIIALLIAFVKATLVVLFFMHLKISSKLAKAFVIATMMFIVILFVGTYADFVTRPLNPAAAGWDDQVQRLGGGGAHGPKAGAATPGESPAEVENAAQH